ncbi:MAG TPA: hypothetical protein G4O03_03690 [Dehalococcoidia bacterium]|nr:hypothetical protein [Dehalococcoidia bacterium]
METNKLEGDQVAGPLKASLSVNGAPVELNAFAEEFLARTVAGAVSALKGAEDIRTLQIHLHLGEVLVILNDKKLPLAPFPNDIIASTLRGMVSSLRGVGRIECMSINIEQR